MKTEKKEKLVTISAKVPESIRAILENTAQKEQRSLSQVVSLMLSSHPALAGAPKNTAKAV
jgi:hypothetical protein